MGNAFSSQVNVSVLNVRLEVAPAIFARKRFTANKIVLRLLDDADQHLLILAYSALIYETLKAREK